MCLTIWWLTVRSERCLERSNTRRIIAQPPGTKVGTNLPRRCARRGTIYSEIGHYAD